MNKPHIHAAIIKAWADGAEIEFRDPAFDGPWCSIPTPGWCLNYVYRVKPVPHKWQEVIEAHIAGKPIQFRIDKGEWYDWEDCERPQTVEGSLESHARHDYYEFRIKPAPHKWQEVMDALAAGKQIEYRQQQTSPEGVIITPDVPGHKWQLWDSPKQPTSAQWDAWWLAYRVKPEPVVEDVCLRWLNSPTSHVIGVDSSPSYAHLRNLRVTFEDGKLVKAEVI